MNISPIQCLGFSIQNLMYNFPLNALSFVEGFFNDRGECIEYSSYLDLQSNSSLSFSNDFTSTSKFMELPLGKYEKIGTNFKACTGYDYLQSFKKCKSGPVFVDSEGGTMNHCFAYHGDCIYENNKIMYKACGYNYVMTDLSHGSVKCDDGEIIEGIVYLKDACMQGFLKFVDDTNPTYKNLIAFDDCSTIHCSFDPENAFQSIFSGRIKCPFTKPLKGDISFSIEMIHRLVTKTDNHVLQWDHSTTVVPISKDGILNLSLGSCLSFFPVNGLSLPQSACDDIIYLGSPFPDKSLALPSNIFSHCKFSIGKNILTFSTAILADSQANERSKSIKCITNSMVSVSLTMDLTSNFQVEKNCGSSTALISCSVDNYGVQTFDCLIGNEVKDDSNMASLVTNPIDTQVSLLQLPPKSILTHKKILNNFMSKDLLALRRRLNTFLNSNLQFSSSSIIQPSSSSSPDHISPIIPTTALSSSSFIFFIPQAKIESHAVWDVTDALCGSLGSSGLCVKYPQKFFYPMLCPDVVIELNMDSNGLEPKKTGIFKHSVGNYVIECLDRKYISFCENGICSNKEFHGILSDRQQVLNAVLTSLPNGVNAILNDQAIKSVDCEIGWVNSIEIFSIRAILKGLSDIIAIDMDNKLNVFFRVLPPYLDFPTPISIFECIAGFSHIILSDNSLHPYLDRDMTCGVSSLSLMRHHRCLKIGKCRWLRGGTLEYIPSDQACGASSYVISITEDLSQIRNIKLSCGQEVDDPEDMKPRNDRDINNYQEMPAASNATIIIFVCVLILLLLFLYFCWRQNRITKNRSLMEVRIQGMNYVTE